MPVPCMHLHHMVGMHTHACTYAFDRPVCCIAQRQQAAAAPPTHLQHMQPQQPQEGRQPLQVTQRGSVPGCHRVTLRTDLQVATTAQTRCSPCCGSYYLRWSQDPQVTILFKKAQVAHTLSDRQHAAPHAPHRLRHAWLSWRMRTTTPPAKADVLAGKGACPAANQPHAASLLLHSYTCAGTVTQLVSLAGSCKPLTLHNLCCASPEAPLLNHTLCRAQQTVAIRSRTIAPHLDGAEPLCCAC